MDWEGIEPSIRERLAGLAAEMGPDGVERDDPVRSVMALLGDRWSPLILLVLEAGACRHADLRRVTAQLSAERAISQRIMTLKLRTLERDGFVHRHSTGEVPPKVTYSLSPLGLQLVAELRRMIDWLGAHRRSVLEAREVFDHED